MAQWTIAFALQADCSVFESKPRQSYVCLLYTSDAADDMQCVDLGGRRIIKKSGCRVLRGVCGSAVFFKQKTAYEM